MESYYEKLNRKTNSLKAPTLTAPSKASMHSALAKLYLKLNNKQRAIEYFQQAAQVMNNSSTFDLDKERKNVNTIKGTSAIFNDASCTSNNDEFTPIFILGLPRSGTTLLELLISSHTNALSTGESNAIAIACMPYLTILPIGSNKANLLNMASPKILDKIKQDYCQFVKDKYGVS